MINSISILSQITKLNKTPKPFNFLFSLSKTQTPFFSSDDRSSEIPAVLRHKDWLSPTQVHHLFASLPNPNTILSALDHYSKRKDYKPNEALFTLILNRLAAARLFADAEAVFRRATSQTPQRRLSDEFFRGAIAALGPEKAAEILLEMPGKYGTWPSTRTFNSALDSLVSARMFAEAHELFSAVVTTTTTTKRLGVEVNTRSLNIMVKGLCEFGSLDIALQVLDEFPRPKLKPNRTTFETLVRYFCLAGRVDEAFEVVARMEAEGVEAGPGSFEALIGGLLRLGRVGDGAAELGRVRLRGIEVGPGPYRAVFTGLVESGRFAEAVEVLRKAVEAGVGPGFEDYERLIRGLCDEDRVDRTVEIGWVLEVMMRKQGFVPNVGLWKVVIERLCCEKSFFDYEEIIGN